VGEVAGAETGCGFGRGAGVAADTVFSSSSSSTGTRGGALGLGLIRLDAATLDAVAMGVTVVLVSNFTAAVRGKGLAAGGGCCSSGRTRLGGAISGGGIR